MTKSVAMCSHLFLPSAFKNLWHVLKISHSKKKRSKDVQIKMQTPKRIKMIRIDDIDSREDKKTEKNDVFGSSPMFWFQVPYDGKDMPKCRHLLMCTSKMHTHTHTQMYCWFILWAFGCFSRHAPGPCGYNDKHTVIGDFRIPYWEKSQKLTNNIVCVCGSACVEMGRLWRLCRWFHSFFLSFQTVRVFSSLFLIRFWILVVQTRLTFIATDGQTMTASTDQNAVQQRATHHSLKCR